MTDNRLAPHDRELLTLLVHQSDAHAAPDPVDALEEHVQRLLALAELERDEQARQAPLGAVRRLWWRWTLPVLIVPVLAACSPSQASVALAVGRTTCAVVARAHEVCQASGLAPDESCPFEIPVILETHGGEQ